MTKQLNKEKRIDESKDIISLLKSIPNIQSQNSKISVAHSISISAQELYNNCGDLDTIYELIKLIRLQIIDGKSSVEKILIGILNSIAYLGVFLTNKEEENKFWFSIQYGNDFMTKIEEIFTREYKQNEKQNNQKQFSEFTIQLAHTIALIQKVKYDWDNYAVIAKRTIIKKFKQIIKQQLKNKQLFIDQEVNISEIEIKKWTQTMKSLESLAEHRANRIYIELLANLFDGVKGFKQQVDDNHFLFKHIIPVIISFVSQNSNQQQSLNQYISIQQYKQYQVGITPSMHLVQGALYLLYRLIHGSDYLCCVAEEHAGVIESLVALSKFQRQRVEDQKTHFLTIDIRETADKCLIEIWNNNGQDDKQNMINDLRFVQLIIERMSTCGESEEESERIRLKVLEMFESVLFQTHEGYYLFPEFPALQKSVDEGIEDAGGIEEFESLIFIVDHWNLEELVLESKTIKEVISNGMIEYFNQISRNIINSPYS